MKPLIILLCLIGFGIGYLCGYLICMSDYYTYVPASRMCGYLNSVEYCIQTDGKLLRIDK